MSDFWKALRLLGWMTLLTGLAYPLGVTFVGRLLFREAVEGSLVRERERVVGSVWIGQNFSDAGYFWPRPSATKYDPLPSGGSNLSVTHRDFIRLVEERRKSWNPDEPPADLLYASGSGLDPHISPEAAFLQIPRVAQARKASGATTANVRELVESSVEGPTFGLLGEFRVNVLLLNRALDAKYPRVGP